MVKPELGAKRQCQNCGTKFFDLNRDPIVCPKCATVFQAAPLSRAAAARTAPANDDDEVEVEVDPAVAETVSLDEVEAAEKVEVVAEDDIEVEDEPADDTFLEEDEEENDDVSGLIDGDIDSDEEG
ncbi:TIGR02300 family protein [Lichenifustis flavocetrariae]|uniref:TIGR02300 family protein n=1 Tax=Lichenifustis flavocetrariae TaxID=2949735 RepID=A0AA41Z371_9HYPH|nr:TIGR02300 family protein [Lichenifustis flavocetrariae]MCW6509520.1 TIGR02300 family protein [Lichenifustis flavocetrariae]